MVIVTLVTGGAFLTRGKSRQTRALRLSLRDSDRVELGSFRARESDQMAGVVNHGDAHMAI
jgi:hypothetical protein